MRVSLFVVCAWTPPPARSLAAPLASFPSTIALTAAPPATPPSVARACESFCSALGRRSTAHQRRCTPLHEFLRTNEARERR
jgi:hypothetical protein